MDNYNLDEKLSDNISDVHMDLIVESKVEEVMSKIEEKISLINNMELKEQVAAEAFNLELDCFHDEDQEDKLWQERTGLDEDSLCGAVETIIFMNDKPVSLNKIKNLIDEEIPLRVIHEALSKLQQGYEDKLHGIRLVEVAEGYQFRTKATFSKYVKDLFKVNSLVLSPTALEVLAIVAYKQPVARSEVDAIRGVDSSHIVRALMDKRLVKIAGRSDEAGKPVLYGTTPEFMEVFNLADISELPPEHELESFAEEKVGTIQDIKTIIGENGKDKFFFDEIDELDKLSSNIKSIISETPFTKSLKVEEKKRFNNVGDEIKSAFDLLEDYVNQDIVKEENRQSFLSEMLVSIADPKVINDLVGGPFNVPLPEEEDDFAMIDLDTGEEISEKDEGPKVQEIFEDVSNEDITNALDSAFAKLMDESRNDDSVLEENNEEIEEIQASLDEKGYEIDEKLEQIAGQGDEFDLDLDFLKNTNENNSYKAEEFLQ